MGVRKTIAHVEKTAVAPKKVMSCLKSQFIMKKI